MNQGAHPHAQQGSNHEQQSDVELNLLLEVIATHDREAEIDARNHAHHDRSQDERQCRRKKQVRDERRNTDGSSCGDGSLGEDRCRRGFLANTSVPV
jgi:hypothetical protein